MSNLDVLNLKVISAVLFCSAPPHNKLRSIQWDDGRILDSGDLSAIFISVAAIKKFCGQN